MNLAKKKILGTHYETRKFITRIAAIRRARSPLVNEWEKVEDFEEYVYLGHWLNLKRNGEVTGVK